MAFSIFLNFAKLSLEIVENQIAQMTDDNQLDCFEEIGAVDDEKLKNNLYNGSIAAMFTANIYESALNAILRSIIGVNELEILKANHNVKLQYICSMFQVDIVSIKGNNVYQHLNAIRKLRNDISHFKCNEVAIGHFIHEESKMPMGTSRDGLVLTELYMT